MVNISVSECLNALKDSYLQYEIQFNVSSVKKASTFTKPSASLRLGAIKISTR